MSFKYQFLFMSCGFALGALSLTGCAGQFDGELAHYPESSEALKICAASNEMPYSNKKGEGFENKIAQLLSKTVNRDIQYVYWKDPRYYVRDFLNRGLCDIAIGVDAGDPRLATTIPYYRSSYVFISRESDDLELENWDSETLQTASLIGFVPGTPAEVMMRKIGRYHDMFNYNKELVGFKSKRNQYVKYEPSRLVADVSAGKAELAVLWGPAAGRYVKASATPLQMTVIPDNNHRADGLKVGFHYSTAMAVRKDDIQLLQLLNQFIKHKQTQITAILEQENIPLLPETEAQDIALK